MIQMNIQNRKLLEELKKRNAESYFHCLRVKALVNTMLKDLNKTGKVTFSESEIDIICKGAMFHDIGKSYVRNFPLTKRGCLNEEERAEMKRHTVMGYEVLRPHLNEAECEIIKNICLYHHERLDGSGYNGLKDIPLYVQIVALCDVYDSLKSDRIYRKAFPNEVALQMIADGKCGLFSEELYQVLYKEATEI